MNLDNPIESVAAALHAACLRDLLEIQYKDRDWEAHRSYMNALSKEDRTEHYRQEKETGAAVGPTIDKSRHPTPAGLRSDNVSSNVGEHRLGVWWHRWPSNDFSIHDRCHM